MVFCFCCVGITIIGTFCWFRLQHEKKAIDHTIHELIRKQQSIDQTSIHHDDKSLTMRLKQETNSDHETTDNVNNYKLPKIVGMPQNLDRFRVASKSDMIDSDIEAEDDQIKEIELAVFSEKQRSKINPLKPLRVISVTIDSEQAIDSTNMMQDELTTIPSSPVSTVITHNTINTNSTNTNTTGSSVISSQISSSSPPITPGAPSLPKEQKLKFKLPKAVTPGQWM